MSKSKTHMQFHEIMEESFMKNNNNNNEKSNHEIIKLEKVGNRTCQLRLFPRALSMCVCIASLYGVCVINDRERENKRESVMIKKNVSPYDLELVAYFVVCFDDEGGGGSSMLISEAPRNNDNLFGRDSLTWPQLNTSYIDEDILCKSKHRIIQFFGVMIVLVLVCVSVCSMCVCIFVVVFLIDKFFLVTQIKLVGVDYTANCHSKFVFFFF